MDFNKLTEEVLNAPVGNSRLTDIAKGVYTVGIDAKTGNVHLISEKKTKTPITINSLASMRIVADPAAAAKVINTRDARTSEDYSTLQNALQLEKVKLNESTKFNCVHRLRILETGTETPTYKNEHYSGYQAYIAETRKISAMPSDTKAEKDAKNAAYTAASEVLRKSGLKAGVALVDNNLILMPVFTVS